MESIEVRATMLRTDDNRRVVIPNSDLYPNRVTVDIAYDRRRMSIGVGIGYGDDSTTAKRIALETVAGPAGILAEPAGSTRPTH